MDKPLDEKYDFLNIVPETSGLQNDSSSEYSSDDSSEENPSLNENLNEDYENELENETFQKRNKTEKRVAKPRKKLSKIPLHLKGLMGEANLRFARGDFETAEKMCYEIIRQEPHAFEPYLSLSQIYESTNQEKSMQYLTIAAHLNPGDVNQWLRLAQIYIDKNNMRAAVTCFTRAIKAQPKNTEFHNKRIELLQTLNDHKCALRCKIKLLQMYSRRDHTLIMNLAKELAEHFHKEKDYAKAIEIFDIPFNKCKDHITPEMVNIYLELLLLNESYPKCLDIFVLFCNIEIEILLNDDNKVQVLSYNMPEGIQIDLRIKFIICLIKLESFDLIDKMLEPLLADETNVENIGDLYLDVAEALMSMNKNLEALKLLIPLIKSRNFSLAAVWLKYAECQERCEMFDTAIDSYYTVVKMAPQHIEVRYPLSNLLLKLNREKEALEVLNQAGDSEEIDVGLLIKQIELLKKLNMLEECFNCFELLLKRHCIILTHESELKSVTFQDSVKEKMQRINKLRDFRGEKQITQDIVSLREPSIPDEYQFYREFLDFCYKNKYYTQLKKFAFYGLSSNRFKTYVFDILVVALYSCILCKDGYHAYSIIRDIILRKNNNTNHLLWNVFNLTLQNSDELRQNRFLMRQPKTKIIKILEANSALSAGSFKIATIHLMSFLKENPSPFIYLLLGIVFLQVTCQKHKEIKKKITQCSIGLFLSYASRRGKAAYQEVYYNLGRLYHQYGILHIAAHYYKLVLDFKHPLIDKHPEILDLKREAAFNLILIYRDSENYTGAKKLMMKYITI